MAGLNPVRIRQAMRYAMLVHESKPQATASDLHDTIRTFKSHLATGFQIPTPRSTRSAATSDVKQELREALQIMSEVQHLPDEDAKLRSSLVPRGFIFHGPAGHRQDAVRQGRGQRDARHHPGGVRARS